MSKSILLIEDDAFLRKSMRVTLEEQGADVREAADGDEAIADLQHGMPDLVILDLLLPKRDGYAVLNHLRQTGADVNVVVLSNLSDYLDQEKCAKLGVKEYIMKSDIDEHDLWLRIKPYL